MKVAGEIEISDAPWIKDKFIACRIEAHAKCSRRFTYQNETFLCKCECHQQDWRSRCEELEVIAAGLYLGHDEALEQFRMYREVYLADQGKVWKPTEDEPFPY